AALAELLSTGQKKQFSHELLYGVGRQNIKLSWLALHKKPDEELRRAITKSEKERIIRHFKEAEIAAFLRLLRQFASRQILDHQNAEAKNSLNEMLANALPVENQRRSFVNALSSFQGNDFREFWNKHLPEQPEFKDNPDLISNVLLTQQLTLLT